MVGGGGGYRKEPITHQRSQTFVNGTLHHHSVDWNSGTPFYTWV